MIDTSLRKRNSCKALIIHDGQLLTVKKEDISGEYFVIPGGGQEWGEELHETLKRECMEEIGTMPTKINELICIREFIGSRIEYSNVNKKLHQIEFYFHCEVDKENVKTGTLMDNRQTGIKWIDINIIDEMRVFPGIIKSYVKKINNKEELPAIYVGAAN